MSAVEDDGSLGPAMRALTPMQRGFVHAMLARPLASRADWAREAGYSDASDGAKVRAHTLWHDPKVQRAVLEAQSQYVGVIGPLVGVAILEQIARTEGHKDQMRAAETLAAMGGLQPKTEHTVNVNHTDNSMVGLLSRIKEAAAFLGIEAKGFLGKNDPLLIEGRVDDAD